LNPPPQSSRAELRLVLGFFLAPLAAAVATFVVVGIPGVLDTRVPNPIGIAAGIGLGGGIAAVFVVVFCAVPALLWLRRRGPIARAHALGVGAILGNVPAVVLTLLAIREQIANGRALHVTEGPAAFLRLVLGGTLVGVATAAVFWRIALRDSELRRRS
jgi:hypothetical protein